MVWLGSRTKDNRLKVLIGYFISYIIIITMLFVVIGGYSYFNIIGASRDRAWTELEYVVRKNTDNLDGNFRNVMNNIVSFYNNREISQLRKMTERFAPVEHFRFQELSRDLSPYATSGTFIDSVTLYFHNSQIFIGSDIVETRPQIYYNIRFPETAKSYVQWRDEQLEHGGGNIYMSDELKNGIVSVYYRLPFTNAETGVTVIADLRVGDLLKSLGLVGVYKREAIFVTGSDGKILYENGSDVAMLRELVTGAQSSYLDADGVRYVWYKEESVSVDWTVHFLVDQRELYSEAMAMRTSLLAVYFSVLAVAILLAVMFAKNTSDPIASILRLFEKEDDIHRQDKLSDGRVWQIMNGGELRNVWKQVSDMSESNTKLARQVMDYREASRSVFYNKLLGGEVLLQEEMAMLQGSETALFDYAYFTVAVVRFLILEDREDPEENYWAVNNAMLIGMEVFESETKGDENYFVHRTATDHLSVILCARSPRTRQELLDIIGPLSHKIHELSGFSLRWGIGDTVKNSDQIFVSYQNASHALYNMDILDKELFAWYDNCPVKRAKTEYGVEDELRLINALTQGNSDIAKKMIRELVERNRAVLESSKSQRNHFVSALSGTALRIGSQIADIGEEQEKELGLYLWQMKNVEDPDIIMNYMFMIVDLIIAVITMRSEQRCQKLMVRIVDYIDGHYEDSGLCLTSIADSFRLTESYISTFFKQNGGSNISQYIEKVRMAHAARLLRDTDGNTTEIAQSVGYGNMNTFYKAFKRYYGVNPKAFREGGAELLVDEVKVHTNR